MHVSTSSVQWLKKYRSIGSEFFSVYRNGQVAISAALIRKLGGDPTSPNFFRAGTTPDGNLVIQLIPQAEHNTENGDTWKLAGSVTSFNVGAMLGWDTGKRYRYDIDPDQQAMIVYKTTAYEYTPQR
jgi:hypothetical protein